MLDKDIEAITDPIERFCCQIKKLSGGVSERVTKMLLGGTFHYTKLNLHIPSHRIMFIEQVAKLDGAELDEGATDAMNVFVSVEPRITLRDLLTDALRNLP